MEPNEKAPAGIDYKAVLADLLAKRDVLNQSIAGISALLGQPTDVATKVGATASPIVSRQGWPTLY